MHSSTNYILWENDTFVIRTPYNPHVPFSEGPHLVVTPKEEIENAWQNELLAGKTFELASRVCRIMDELEISPWFNIQANGNWGLLPGGTPFFHIHIYGRNKTGTWAKPIVLPEAPNTYQNEPMPENIRTQLTEAFAKL